MSRLGGRICLARTTALLMCAITGCAPDRVDFRGSKDAETETEVPQEYEANDSLSLTDRELNDLSTRNRRLARRIQVSLVPMIDTLVEECIETSALLAKLKSDLAPVAEETILLQNKRDALEKIIDEKTNVIAENRAKIGKLQGNAEALRQAIRGTGSSFKSKLITLNRELSAQIASSRRELRKVSIERILVLYSLPFNESAFRDLDQRQDELQDSIEEMQEILRYQTHLLMNEKLAALDELRATLALVKKEIRAKVPVWRAEIRELKAEVSRIHGELRRVLEEIANNGEANKFTLPTIPKECELIGVK